MSLPGFYGSRTNPRPASALRHALARNVPGDQPVVPFDERRRIIAPKERKRSRLPGQLTKSVLAKDRHASMAAGFLVLQ
jgi:hypothetical protein